MILVNYFSLYYVVLFGLNLARRFGIVVYFHVKLILQIKFLFHRRPQNQLIMLYFDRMLVDKCAFSVS